jgi:D-glycero-D-manno-heptose 1,7-bisphosphate phosphatase
MLILLDRDGVLNEDRTDFVKSPAELKLLPGAAEGLRMLNDAGHAVSLITNQSAVGRGIISAEKLDEIHGALRSALARAGARLDHIEVCTDPPWAASDRRKPGPGMLRAALERFRTSPAQAVMIGDDLRDLEAAHAAGVARILLRTGKGAGVQARGIPPHIFPVSVYDDLREAAAALTGASSRADGSVER